MNIFSNLWGKLAKSKRYREEFVAAQVKRGIPFQARALLKAREGWTQETLAERAGLTQGVVSRALNPNYGNLTLNTIIRIAAGFDVAFIGRFVPFSELENWFANMSEETVQVPTFEEEQAKRQSEAVIAERNLSPRGFCETIESYAPNMNVLAGGQHLISAEAANKPSRIREAIRGSELPRPRVPGLAVPEQRAGGGAYETLSGTTG
jgi:transcriptional regulator with XRE-family HTH domain